MTPRGQLLVRGKSSPRVGDRVTDVRGREVGRVQDLVGPVREPYVVVFVAQKGSAPKLLGQDLFTR
ncbi:MAG: H/ACA RNA-protein complex component Gar1 [Halobacteriales archaeon]|nr:H/ACA RNA-protein complex component Gar1 [Halobacteriales archaeon]